MTEEIINKLLETDSETTEYKNNNTEEKVDKNKQKLEEMQASLVNDLMEQNKLLASAVKLSDNIAITRLIKTNRQLLNNVETINGKIAKLNNVIIIS